MVSPNDIVITGVGCVSPIGIGRAAFWEGLTQGRCGIQKIHAIQDEHAAATFFGGVIEEFDAKAYVTPRKTLKVMNREVQTAFSAAQLAIQDANLTTDAYDPLRIGVVYGSEMLPGEIPDITPAVIACYDRPKMQFERWGVSFGKNIFPLWLLKNLPNMPACHVAIHLNAQGPSNTIVQDEVSGLQALQEAINIIQRDAADVMVVGGVGGRVGPTRLVYRHPEQYNRAEPEPGGTPCRPFDSRRSGIVPGEASAAVVIERRRHAEARNANVLGEVVGCATRFGGPSKPFAASQPAIEAAIRNGLHSAGIQPTQLQFVSAQGFSHDQLDILESRAIRATVGDVPVTAFSSYYGSCGAGSGLIDLVASVLCGVHQRPIPIRGYLQADPQCPIRAISGKFLPDWNEVPYDQSFILKVGFTPLGHASAVVLRCKNQNS